MSSDNTKRDEFILSEALAVLEEGDIETCDSCEKYVLRQHMHSYDGSMGKQYSVCPECDLPLKSGPQSRQDLGTCDIMSTSIHKLMRDG